jgi:hypothetical protein
MRSHENLRSHQVADSDPGTANLANQAGTPGQFPDTRFLAEPKFLESLA